MTDADKQALKQLIGTVFTPASPVSEADVFAGRQQQLAQISEAIVERGKHAILFGERGVGKTSLANVVEFYLRWPNRDLRLVRVNCDSQDTYTTIWRRAFDLLKIEATETPVGFKQNPQRRLFTGAELFPYDASPADVCRLLSLLADTVVAVPIFDEFDRISKARTRALMADTIKALSDQPTSATIIVVGVADSVDDLIAEHASVERTLIQVPVPRMSEVELQEFLQKGADKLQMAIDADAKAKIAALSRGLPHYAHLLGKHAFRFAVHQGRAKVEKQDVAFAVVSALDEVQQSIKTAYATATESAHKDAIFGRVLAACALAESSDLGWFRAKSVAEPLSQIMGKPYRIAAYTSHLGAFLRADRGSVLQREGKPHNFRYRFINPLMQPYAVLKGISDGYVEPDSNTLFDQL